MAAMERAFRDETRAHARRGVDTRRGPARHRDAGRLTTVAAGSRMSRILVVHFSRDGHTRAIASEIARGCGGPREVVTEAITEASGRAGPWGYLRSALEAVLGIAPTLASTKRLARRGDLVVIGTPVWFWNMASPVRSYLLAHHAQLSRVAFFCTCGGSGAAKVFRDMQALCGRAPVATLALTEAKCAAGAHQAEMAAFLRALQRGRAAAPDVKRKQADAA